MCSTLQHGCVLPSPEDLDGRGRAGIRRWVCSWFLTLIHVSVLESGELLYSLRNGQLIALVQSLLDFRPPTESGVIVTAVPRYRVGGKVSVWR